ncbi:MAG: dihydrofolate reductase [Haliscomenobacter sp.]|nr:dihydrofolate reductase [Haliscomenobacter sp.]
MRQIVLFIASSLDGYIARPDGQVDWLFHDEDYGYSDFYDSIDTTLMGKKTYKDILGFGEFPYPDKKNYVFSRKHGLPHNPHVEYVHGDIPAFVRSLKKEEGKDIWLVGGGQMNTILLSCGQIDRMILSIHPVILGVGIPLFGSGIPAERWFNLEGVKTYSSGLAQLTYRMKG